MTRSDNRCAKELVDYVSKPIKRCPGGIVVCWRKLKTSRRMLVISEQLTYFHRWTQWPNHAEYRLRVQKVTILNFSPVKAMTYKINTYRYLAW